MLADLEELKTMDASESYPRRNNAKEALTTQKGEIFNIPNNR